MPLVLRNANFYYDGQRLVKVPRRADDPAPLSFGAVQKLCLVFARSTNDS